jgi:hypothetical protein
MSEHRRHPRLPLCSPVEFTGTDPKHVTFGVATDVSVSGIFIETAFPAAAGRLIVVRVWRPGWSDEVQVPLRGVVRWSRPGGMGVEFTSLGRREARVLGALVAESAASRGAHAPTPA